MLIFLPQLVAAAYAVHRDELAIGPILNAIDSNVKIDLEALHAEMQKKNYGESFPQHATAY
jgi:hypothetical protein